MNRALLELLVRSVRGRIVRWFRLFKQPRYLIGLAAGVLYFVAILGPNLFMRRSGFLDGTALSWIDAHAVPLQVFGSLLAAAGLTIAWIVVSPSSGLRLSEAEIHVLLSAPLSRRRIIQHVALKGQPGILIAAAIFTVLRGGGGPAGHAGHFVTLWLLLTIMDLHHAGIVLSKARLRELSPTSAWAWRGAFVGAVVSAWAFVLWRVHGAVSQHAGLLTAGDIEALQAFSASTATALQGDWCWHVLAPLRWCLAPLFAQDLAALALAWAGPVALLLLHHEWVVRSDASFEEASLKRAKRQLTRADPRLMLLHAASEKKRRRAPFTLRPTGHPAMAIFWKSLVAHGRRPLWMTFVILAGLVTVLTGVNAALGAPLTLTIVEVTIGLALLLAVPVFGGLTTAMDLRSDLIHFELVRPWPLSGRSLLLAEVLAPTTRSCQVALFGCALVLSADLGAQLTGKVPAHVLTQWSVLAGTAPWLATPLTLLGAFIAACGLAFLSTAVINVAVLHLPSWFAWIGKKRQGVAATGHFALIGLGLALALGIGLLPGTVLVAMVVAIQSALLGWMVGPWQAPIFGLLIAAPLALEAWLVIRFAAHRWETMDPTEEVLDGAME